MAYGIVSTPGSKHGPCENSCHHRDCDQLKQLAEEICVYCGDPIGYDRRYCHVKEEVTIVHWACAYFPDESKGP